MLLAVGLIPSISVKQVERVTIISAGDGTRTAGEFPFRLSGQAITRALQNVGRDRHPLGVSPSFVAEVAPLVLGQTLLLAQPVAVGGGSVPVRTDRGSMLIGTEFVEEARSQSELLIGLHEPLELLNSDLLGGDGETAGDTHAPGGLDPGDTFRLGRRRAHEELDR